MCYPKDITGLMLLMQKELSHPYSIKNSTPN